MNKRIVQFLTRGGLGWRSRKQLLFFLLQQEQDLRRAKFFVMACLGRPWRLEQRGEGWSRTKWFRTLEQLLAFRGSRIFADELSWSADTHGEASWTGRLMLCALAYSSVANPVWMLQFFVGLTLLSWLLRHAGVRIRACVLWGFWTFWALCGLAPLFLA